MYKYHYPRPAVTVDVVVFSEMDEKVYILLIRRKNNPYQGYYAFPGGFVDDSEDLPDAATRELLEETGLDLPKLIPFRAYGTPGRDPRGHTVGAVYFTFIEKECPLVMGRDDAEEAAWFELAELPELAFDHGKIIRDLIDFITAGFYSGPLTHQWLQSIASEDKRRNIKDYFFTIKGAQL